MSVKGRGRASAAQEQRAKLCVWRWEVRHGARAATLYCRAQCDTECAMWGNVGRVHGDAMAGCVYGDMLLMRVPRVESARRAASRVEDSTPLLCGEDV